MPRGRKFDSISPAKFVRIPTYYCFDSRVVLGGDFRAPLECPLQPDTPSFLIPTYTKLSGIGTKLTSVGEEVKSVTSVPTEVSWDRDIRYPNSFLCSDRGTQGQLRPKGPMSLSEHKRNTGYIRSSTRQKESRPADFFYKKAI